MCAGEGRIEKSEGRKEKEHDRVEQTIYNERGESSSEGDRRLFFQRVSPGEFSSARGKNIVHHHADRCRPPKRTEPDSRRDGLEDRSPAERADGKNRGGAEDRPGEEERICFRKFLRYFGGRDSVQRPVNERRAQHAADDGAPSRLQLLLG